MSPPNDAPAALPAVLPDAERRQVGVMMVDMIGSSRLARRLDPEDFSALTLAYRRAASGAIAANGGFVARYLGDGILAYWGYPRAHEDDTRRAIAGGLAVQQAVAAASQALGLADMHLAARVGIAVGVVVVGRIEGVGAEAGADILGDAPNLADRIQKLAPPGGVLVSAAARQLAAAAFDFVPAGEVVLAPDSGTPSGSHSGTPIPPVAVFRVVAPRPGSPRGRSASGGALHGRATELAALEAAWQAARGGTGKAILVCGEAGIGKSTLTGATRQLVLAQGGTWLAAGCLAETTAAPLHPARELLRAWLGLDGAPGQPGTTDPSHQARLIAALDDAAAGAGRAALLLPIYDPLATAPGGADTRGRTLAALSAWVRAAAAQAPLALLVEDLHWADATTLEWLAALAADAPQLRLLLLGTSRHAPPGGAVFQPLSLGPLPAEATAAIVRELDHDGSITQAQRSAIVRRAEGNPLFAEELALLARQAASADLLTLPSSLNESLLARLDELGPARHVAQAAAVLGRDFDRAVLGEVVDMAPSALEGALAALAQAGLVHGLADRGATHGFKHALVRDAAYRSLLRAPRQALHARAAAVLRARFADQAEARPELVALHLEQAGQWDGASEWWGTAGERAARLGAAREAADAFARAIRLLAAADGSALLNRRAGLLVRLGAQRMAIDGNAADTVEAAFADAIDALDRATAPDGTLRFAALRGLHTHAMVRANIVTALAIGQQLLRIADEHADDQQVMQAHRVQGLACLLAGRHAEAEGHYAETLARYDPVRHADHRFRYGSDPACVVLAQRAWGHALCGRTDAADADAARARTAAHDLRHPHTSAHVLGVDALRLLSMRRDSDAALAATAARTIAEQQQFAYWLAWCDVVLAAVRRHDDPAGAAEALAVAISTYGETGARQLLPCALALRAECLLASGAPRLALDVLGDAASVSDGTGLRLYAPEVLRLTGRAARLLQLGDPERHLQDAQALAESQGAWMLALRAMNDRLAGPAPSALRDAATALRDRVAAGGAVHDVIAADQLLATAAGT